MTVHHLNDAPFDPLEELAARGVVFEHLDAVEGGLVVRVDPGEAVGPLSPQEEDRLRGFLVEATARWARTFPSPWHETVDAVALGGL